jgi:D-lyxose ketol-isomerase
MEDIINRGGGTLMIQLWNSDSRKALTNERVTVFVDGVSHQIEAGGIVGLNPGEFVYPRACIISSGGKEYRNYYGWRSKPHERRSCR